MVAGVELEADEVGHEMSNQQREKPNQHEKSGHDRNVLGNSAERAKSLANWLPWANQQIKSHFNPGPLRASIEG